jgi:predicted PurR-regulated permease PerM
MPEPPPPSPTAALVPLGLRRATAYTWRVLLLVGAVLLVLYVLARLQVVFLPLMAALLLAALADPLAQRLRATFLPNFAIALVVLLLLAAVLAGAGFVIVPEVIGQIRDVNINLAQGLQRIERFVLATFPVSQAQFEDAISDAFGTLRSSIANIAGQVVGIAGLALQLVLGAFITLFLLFFFVKDGPRFYRWLQVAVPESRRREVDELLPHIWETLRSYLVGVVIVGFFDAVFISLALIIVGVPLVLPLAVLTFFGAFFPLVGAIVAGTVATLVALVSGGLIDALIVAGSALLVQQVEGNVLQPVIMGRQVELHPVITLLSVTAGGTVGGIAGAFLAVPVVAVVRRTLRYASPRLAAAGDHVREERKAAGRLRKGVRPEAPGEGGTTRGDDSEAPLG